MRSCSVLVILRCFGASIPLTRRWVSTRGASDVHSGRPGRFAGETRHETWRSLCITPSGDVVGLALFRAIRHQVPQLRGTSVEREIADRVRLATEAAQRSWWSWMTKEWIATERGRASAGRKSSWCAESTRHHGRSIRALTSSGMIQACLDR